MSQQTLFDTALAVLRALPVYDTGRVQPEDVGLFQPDMSDTGVAVLHIPGAIVRRDTDVVEGRHFPDTSDSSRLVGIVIEDWHPLQRTGVPDEQKLTPAEWDATYRDHIAIVKAAITRAAFLIPNGVRVTIAWRTPTTVNLKSNVPTWRITACAITRRER